MVQYYRTLRYIYMIRCTLNKFINYNPPCKECLVQGMCLMDRSVVMKPYPYVRTKTCSILQKFIEKNDYFYIGESKKGISDG